MTIPAHATDIAAEHRLRLPPGVADAARAITTPPRRFPTANRLTLQVRQIHPGDATLLADTFARLSPSSRISRFLVPKSRLTASELRYLTEVDHHDHEAVIALTRIRAEPVGVARSSVTGTTPRLQRPPSRWSTNGRAVASAHCWGDTWRHAPEPRASHI